MKKIERIILNSAPVQLLVQWSKKIVLPGFEQVPLYDVIVFFIEEIKKEGLTERASAIAFNFIMAIPPTCLFLFTLIPHLPFLPKASIQRQLNGLIRDIIPAREHNTNLIHFVDSFFSENRIGLLSFGFILLLFFASNGMMGLMRSFNKTTAGFIKRTGLQARWAAIRLTAIIMGLLLACLLLLITQGAAMKWLGMQSKLLISFLNVFRWVFMLALIYFTFGFIYKYAPAIQKRWRLASPGTIIGSFLSVLLTFGFSIFVNNFGKYNALYGSIGTVIVLMILIYLNSLVLIIGYELNASIHSIKALAEERTRIEEGQIAGDIRKV